MASNTLQPLNQQQAIVDPKTGLPSLYFMRYLYDRGGYLTDIDAQLEFLRESIEGKADKTTEIIAGVGLDGGGDLSSDVTVDLADTGVTPGTYGDGTNVPQITVDQQGRITVIQNIAITGGGGGGGGGSSDTYHFPSGNFTGNDTGSFATLSNAFIPGEDIALNRLYAGFNNQTVGNEYSMFIAEINSSGAIQATVATATSRLTTTATGFQFHGFDIPDTNLTKGTMYIVALVITSGTGTTACRVMTGGDYAYDNLPLDYGAMAAAWGSQRRRFWYAQNSDAPTSGSPSGNATTTPYLLGMRKAGQGGSSGAVWDWGWSRLSLWSDVSGTTTASLGAGSINTALRTTERANCFWFNNGGTLRSITIDFNSPQIISGIHNFQDVASDNGSWQVQYSDDGTTFIDIGSPQTWGAGTYTAWTFSNSTPHRYWRLDQRSGTTAKAAWQRGLMFRWGAA